MDEVVTLISKTRCRHTCKCTKPKRQEINERQGVYVPPSLKEFQPETPVTIPHKKEVFSDGWTRWECLNPHCGQIKFTRGEKLKEIKI